jgi:NAD(P)-dependent dehydrogenase (short-subunit alcohol dehydrogenase family)
MDEFRDRVAVVTGGASGIGAALARAFAARGARIALADVDEAALARTAGELEAAGAAVLAVPTDVTQRESVERLAREVTARFGAVHLVCNNAGVVVAGEMARCSHADWEFVMAVNFWGVVHGVETFVPRLLEQRAGGHVLNTASMAGLVGMQWLGLYTASKFAVVGLSETLHRELKPHGIGVSVLCPMMVATDLTARSARLRAGDAASAAPGAPPPPEGAMAGSVKTPEEVARRVVRGIERKALWILTHEEQREILRRRAARLDETFEGWEG